MSELDEAIGALRSDIGRAEWIDDDYVDCVEVKHLRTAIAALDGLQEALGALQQALSDTNDWLKRNSLGGTAHQLHLERLLTKPPEAK